MAQSVSKIASTSAGLALAKPWARPAAVTASFIPAKAPRREIRRQAWFVAGLLEGPGQDRQVAGNLTRHVRSIWLVGRGAQFNCACSIDPALAEVSTKTDA